MSCPICKKLAKFNICFLKSSWQIPHYVAGQINAQLMLFYL